MFKKFTIALILALSNLLSYASSLYNNYDAHVSGGLYETTKILRSDNQWHDISDVKVGWRLQSFDEKTGEIIENEVTDFFIHQVRSLVKIKIEDIDENLFLSPDQVVLTKNNKEEFEWIKAKNLTVGHQVVTLQGIHEISYFEHRDGDFKVYNLELSSTHTFFVGGQSQIVVHNAVFILAPVIAPGIIEGLLALGVGAAVIGTMSDGKMHVRVPKWAIDTIETIWEELGAGKIFSQNTSYSYEAGENIDMSRFSEKKIRKNRSTILRDPKSGEYLELDRGRHTGAGPHGGSEYKLRDKRGQRIGSVTKDGKFLRD